MTGVGKRRRSKKNKKGKGKRKSKLGKGKRKKKGGAYLDGVMSDDEMGHQAMPDF